MTEIEQLIADLEAAPAGVGDLSSRVNLVLTDWERRYRPAAWHSEQGQPQWRNLPLGFTEWGQWSDRRPDPSRNIIHVLAMVPEEHAWRIEKFPKDENLHYDVFKAWVFNFPQSHGEGNAKTPELALCAALVKERRSRE